MIQRIWTIMKAEFLHIVRDPLSLVIALAMPLFMLFLCSYCIIYEMKELPFAVYDMDKSVESRNYIQAIDNTSFFNVKYHVSGHEKTKHLIARGEARCAIVIPSGFSRKAREYRPATIQTLVDGSEMNTAEYIINYMSAINAVYSVSMKTEYIKRYGLSVDLEPVSLVARSWYNQSLRDFTFIVTGIFSLGIMGFVPILSALAIVREKESGSIQQIFISPIHSYEYIAGKMSPYVILLTIDFLCVILFGIWWFELPFRGSFFNLSVATFFMVFATVAIGFFISTMTKSQLTAMLLGIIFTLMPAFIFGDTIAPIENSPQGWRLYSCLFPGRFYTGIVRAEILRGAAVQHYLRDAFSLLAYCVIIFSICALRIRNKKI